VLDLPGLRLVSLVAAAISSSIPSRTCNEQHMTFHMCGRKSEHDIHALAPSMRSVFGESTSNLNNVQN
jgi:hypothetical protein